MTLIHHPLFYLLCLLLSHFASTQDITSTSVQVRTVVVATVTLAPSYSPASPQYTSPSSLQSAALNSTNVYRAQHNATALTWNASLADFAQEHVRPCVFEHSHGPYGENLAEGYVDVEAAIGAWGDERERYDFGKGEFGEGTGHFTQLVWKSSTSTGCAVQDCGRKNGWLLFCEYFPPGNVIGHFRENVQKQGKYSVATLSSGTARPTSTSAAGRVVVPGATGGVGTAIHWILAISFGFGGFLRWRV